MQEQYDLLIQGGRVIDPAQNIDGKKDVAIRNGRVALVDNYVSPEHARQVIDAAGKIVTPGLIDLHTHVFVGLNISVEPDPLGAKSGVTTMVDAGTAGAANFGLFRDHVIRIATTRIVTFLNIWITGGSMMSLSYREMASGKWSKTATVQAPALTYFDDVRYASVDEALRVIEENRDLIVGVKVWVNRFVAGGDIEPLRRAKRVADAMDLPVMVCTYFGPPSMADILPLLGEGDIQTHFYGIFTGLVGEDGKILPAALAARDRGVVFDVGHGAGSFDFDVARQAVAGGFAPDTISTDIWVETINGPVYDLPMTMAKFMALGMSLEDVIRATTWRPAEVLNMEDVIGSLRVGMEADVAVFDLDEGEFDLVDTQGKHVTGTGRLENVLTIKAGRVLG